MHLQCLMVLAQEPPPFPLTFTWGWALGAKIILATLNVVHSLLFIVWLLQHRQKRETSESC